MWQGIAVCLSLLGAEEVSVKPLHGDMVRGALVSLTEKSLAIRSSTGEIKFDAAAVHSVKPAIARAASPPDTQNAPKVVVELTDNSVVVGAKVTFADSQATVDIPGTDAVAIPQRVIRSLRFRFQDDELQKQWAALAATNATGDKLIVRKKNAETAPSATATVVLDQLEGIVRGISPAAVQFEFDGETIAVQLEKVEGIIFHQRQVASWPDAVCRIRDVRGGEWQVQSMELADAKINLQTVSGIRTTLPWDRVGEIDFTAGNLVFLSDLKPEAVEWRPYLVTPATPPALAKWFSFRRDQTADGSVLTLGGQSFEKGLSVHSRTLITYRLTKNFQHFQAIAGIDEKYRGPGNLRLMVVGDERTLLSKDMRGTDPPLELDLDISGIRRLKILVDFGEDRSDAGDHLLLCDARLTK